MSRKPRRSSRTFAAASTYADLDAMAADPDIDAIYVATPNALHAEQALRIISHGKAVLVEKPLATSVADAERIASAAAEQKCFVMEAMWTRFLPAVQAARRLVDGGAIGTVRKIDAELAYRRDEDAGSRFFDPGLGGGAALDLGVYPVSLTLHFLGKPVKGFGALAGLEKRRRHAHRYSTCNSQAALRLAFPAASTGRRQSIGDRGKRRGAAPGGAVPQGAKADAILARSLCAGAKGQRRLRQGS